MRRFRLKGIYDFKAFIEYLNDTNDIYKNIAKYNTVKENRILILFDDM